MGKLPRLFPSPPLQPPPQDPLPKLGVAPPTSRVAWKFIQRLTINAVAGLPDTSSLGDLQLPRGGLHAKVFWSAVDTSANTSAAFGSVQVAAQGGAFDTAIGGYIWVDFEVTNTNGGVSSTASGGSPNGNDNRWAAFVTTGGGTGVGNRSRGRIYLQDYSDPTQIAMAWWDILQVNTGSVIRRMGDGYHTGTLGPLTALRFISGAGNLAPGTYFELWVATAA